MSFFVFIFFFLLLFLLGGALLMVFAYLLAGFRLLAIGYSERNRVKKRGALGAIAVAVISLLLLLRGGYALGLDWLPLF